jgi:hypothetical protein
MALQLPVQYEQLIELVDQLSEEQQNDLIQRLLTQRARQHPLTIEEKLKLLDSLKIHAAVREEPSIRREDWYDDDGR